MYVRVASYLRATFTEFVNWKCVLGLFTVIIIIIRCMLQAVSDYHCISPWVIISPCILGIGTTDDKLEKSKNEFQVTEILQSALCILVYMQIGDAVSFMHGRRHQCACGHNIPRTFAAIPCRGYKEIHIWLQHLEFMLPVQFATTITLKIWHIELKAC